MNGYKISKKYEHIITKFKEDEIYYADNLYDLCRTFNINYNDEELELLEDDLEMGYVITLGDLQIRKLIDE